MDHDENEDNEQKLFSLKEAESARRELEPVLIEAMENRGKVAELDDQLGAVANRILMMGGITIEYERVARVRSEHNRLLTQIKDALDRIHATGCVVKDLDSGLLDFPAILKNEEVYLCWRVGEDRIRFYHRQDEGFFRAQADRPRRHRPETSNSIINPQQYAAAWRVSGKECRERKIRRPLGEFIEPLPAIRRASAGGLVRVGHGSFCAR